MFEIVFCTVPNEVVAERIARGLVEQRLAACVNVIPGVKSFYRWEGEIQADDELLLKIKTTAAKREALFAWIAENHPYEVPEALSVRVEAGLPAYLRFVEAETAAE